MSDRRGRLDEWMVVAFVIVLINLGIVMPLFCAADRLRLSVASELESAEPDPAPDAEPPPASRSPNIALIRP